MLGESGKSPGDQGLCSWYRLPLRGHDPDATRHDAELLTSRSRTWPGRAATRRTASFEGDEADLSRGVRVESVVTWSWTVQLDPCRTASASMSVCSCT